MLLDPTERNVNPLLFQTGTRTVMELVLTLAIHDKNVTMAKTAVGASSAHRGFTRGAIALHRPESSGQHRSPVRGPIAVPCPYKYEQEHEESKGTDHAVWCDPFFTQSPAAIREENTFSPLKAPRNHHTPPT